MIIQPQPPLTTVSENQRGMQNRQLPVILDLSQIPAASNLSDTLNP